MLRVLTAIVTSAVLVTGCGERKPAGTSPPAPTATAQVPAPAAATPGVPPPMRNFAAVKIGPYDVHPMFEEEIKNGHFNIRVKGGDVKAVRMWVGPEDASGVMVVKTEPEFDYNHGHVEVPDPIPVDAKLWIEIESPTGELHKGSTPLQHAP